MSQSTPKEVSEIHLPVENEKRVAQMRGKLAEYRERAEEEPFMAPELQFENIYKLEIMTTLLRDGVVNTFELALELTERFGGFDGKQFQNACSVIDDYCKTGGFHVRNGGLPEVAA